jgi:hypothetical protein
MTLTQTPGTIERFCRTPWSFQQTFVTPPKNLQSFVATIASALDPLERGCVTIGQVVFEPENLIGLLAKHSLPTEFNRHWSLTAEGQQETEALLEAALGDWVDFIFVPTPSPFVIYADHDTYITFYANTESNLNRVAQALLANGFEEVPDWKRDRYL